MTKKNLSELWAILIAWFMISFNVFGVDVLTQRNDNNRSGLNLAETNLTPAALKTPGLFHKLYFRLIDADAYAQPLYVSDLEIDGKLHNLIYVATENNSVYAFEDNPSATIPSEAPFWKINLGPSITTDELNSDLGDSPPGCTDLTTQIGITSTPVIDRTNGILYVVAKTKASRQYAHTLYALDIRTGGVKRKTLIEGSVPGKGTGSDATGRIAFQPAIQLNRPACCWTIIVFTWPLAAIATAATVTVGFSPTMRRI